MKKEQFIEEVEEFRDAIMEYLAGVEILYDWGYDDPVAHLKLTDSWSIKRKLPTIQLTIGDDDDLVIDATGEGYAYIDATLESFYLLMWSEAEQEIRRLIERVEKLEKTNSPDTPQ